VTGDLGPGPRAFFYFILFFILAGVLVSFPKNKKKHCFLSVFSLFLSLSLSLYTHFGVLLSLINVTKVSCEGKLKKGVAYKL
jgi:predicted membrane protein